MKYLDNIKFIQIDPNNVSGKFLKVREYFFTKNKISVFANKLFKSTCYVQNLFGQSKTQPCLSVPVRVPVHVAQCAEVKECLLI